MASDQGVAKSHEHNFQEKSETVEKELTELTHSKRPVCKRCKRPKKVCLCVAIPLEPLKISTTVYILQHPEERTRSLTTVPLLCACLPSDKCVVYNDVRYSQDKYPALHDLLKCPYTLVLYPDVNATDLREVVKEFTPGQKCNLIVPDGTWRQARAIFKKNSTSLEQARKVKLNESTKSHYVIRTQPTRNSLSTLEAVAMALSILESRDEITEILRRPLQLLCDIQIQHGAVPHESKEEKREQELLLLEKMKRQENEQKVEKEDEISKTENREEMMERLKEDKTESQIRDQAVQKLNEASGNETLQQTPVKRSKLDNCNFTAHF